MSEPTRFSFTLTGELAAKANQRRIVTIRTKPRLVRGKIRTTRPLSIKSDKARALVGSLVAQLLPMKRNGPFLPIEGPVRLRCQIFYATNRPDLDHSLLKDALQAAGVIKNDRQIICEEVTKGIDPARPRVEGSIEAVTWDRQKGTIMGQVNA